MGIHQTLNEGRVPVKIWTDDIDASALKQLVNVSRLPIVYGHIAAMPDVHPGIGATVGAVIPTLAAIIPAAVGVDIGCGMNAVRLSLSAAGLPDNLRHLRTAIEAAVPVGFTQHTTCAAATSQQRALGHRLQKIASKHPAIAKMQKNFQETWLLQLGTLGGGNHFVEICLDESEFVWIMLHSGSRGVGNVLGRHFIELARGEMQRAQIQLPDRDLAYLCEGSAHFDDYVEAVEWAQEYALLNRSEMMHTIVKVLRQVLPESVPPWTIQGEAINCHHNYVVRESHFGKTLFVTRKGAISAKQGEMGIIPGSMGTKSYIVRGRGNAESLCSCSHGAGRRMSRAAAKNKFNRLDLEQQTSGVECRKDAGVIDEIPGAYKGIDAVMDNQRDLVEVVHTLKQVVCVKG